jgi:ATP-dependent DNA helicase RecQ
VSPSTLSASAVQSFALFDDGLSLEQVAERLGRAPSTTYGYLEAYVRHRRVTDPTPWVSQEDFARIQAAIASTGAERLRPIYDALDGQVAYERIRVAVACLANSAAENARSAVHESTS